MKIRLNLRWFKLGPLNVQNYPKNTNLATTGLKTELWSVLKTCKTGLFFKNIYLKSETSSFFTPVFLLSKFGRNTIYFDKSKTISISRPRKFGTVELLIFFTKILFIRIKKWFIFHKIIAPFAVCETLFIFSLGGTSISKNLSQGRFFVHCIICSCSVFWSLRSWKITRRWTRTVISVLKFNFFICSGRRLSLKPYDCPWFRYVRLSSLAFCSGLVGESFWDSHKIINLETLRLL